MNAHDSLKAIAEKPFVEALIKLEELLVQSGRAFLIGAGCSKCAGLPLTMELTEKVLTSDLLDPTTKTTLMAISDLFKGADAPNIEDFLSELVDLLAIADRRTSRGATEKEISLAGKSYSAEQLQSAVDQIKRGIAKVIHSKVEIETHRRFVKSLHRHRRPGKHMSGQAIDYLVLNYDTVLENALALERIPFSDGLDGGATGWWSPELFDRNDLDARIIKLHGSIDWLEFPDGPLPRRVGGNLKIEADDQRRILIWPASTKYRETQLDPYAQLTLRARQVLRPRNGAQCVLVVCGYRFRDQHINLELERALRDSAGNLTIVVFTSDNEPQGILKKWYKDEQIGDQLLVFANRGFFHGNQSHIAKTDLLWWKFENMTRLFEGER